MPDKFAYRILKNRFLLYNPNYPEPELYFSPFGGALGGKHHCFFFRKSLPFYSEFKN